MKRAYCTTGRDYMLPPQASGGGGGSGVMGLAASRQRRSICSRGEAVETEFIYRCACAFSRLNSPPPCRVASHRVGSSIACTRFVSLQIPSLSQRLLGITCSCADLRDPAGQGPCRSQRGGDEEDRHCLRAHLGYRHRP